MENIFRENIYLITKYAVIKVRMRWIRINWMLLMYRHSSVYKNVICPIFPRYSFISNDFTGRE